MGLCLLFGALDLQLGLRTHIEEGGLQPPLLMRLLVVFFFCSRGFGLVAGAENSYGGRWPPATLFLMSLLLVALFSSRGFRLVVGAVDLWLGLWTCS